MKFWSDKLVWITGATGGIGSSLAQVLASKGSRLILSSRNEEGLKKLKESLPMPESHHILPLDISSPHRIAELIDREKGLISTVDVLINNAGISQRALAWEASPESERLIMEVNYFGTIALTKGVLPHMLSRNSGHIVVMSSAVGKFGFPLRSSYAASKHALHGYFESLRAELHPHNIGITMVCPGRINTEISKHALRADGSKHNEHDPGQKNGLSPDECARIVARAVSLGKAEQYIGKEQALIYLYRFFPALFRKIVSRINPK